MPEELVTDKPLSRDQGVAKIRILVADDHPVIRVGVRNMLRREPAVTIIGEASDGEEAVAQTLACKPDVLLLDLKMPRLPGIEVLRAIVGGSVPVRILLLTGSTTTQEIIEALQVGARGILTKDAVTDQLADAVAAVFEGDYWINGSRVANLVGVLHDLMRQVAVPERRTYSLTPREKQVIGCIVEGCTNRDIATELGASPETIKRHLSHIYAKTGVSTRVDLALFAIENRLIETDVEQNAGTA
jgi:two-component system nitrate/nitrite response regulator NarL